MSDLSEALLYLDLDKGPDAPGPLFEEPRRLLERDPRLRAGWFQYQALRALALEASPEPGERMLRAVLLQCRRERVDQQLARATGADEEARAILLGRVPENRNFPGWILGLLLLGTIGLGWMAFRGNWLSAPSGDSAGQAPATSPALAAGGEPVPFEFPVRRAPADAALAAPSDESAAAESDADDTHNEVPAARQARMILREHLHEAQARQMQEEAAAEGPLAAAQATPPADPWAAPSPAPTPLPSPVPAPTARPKPLQKPRARKAKSQPVRPAALARKQPLPTALPSTPPPPMPAQSAQASAATASAAILDLPAGLTLSSRTLTRDNGSMDISVGFPERRDIDLRLFDGTGKSVRVVAVGAFGPGIQHFPMDARSDAGQALDPGTYYLRVMTPWFLRVEPIQIQ